jgi:hypothetical protein
LKAELSASERETIIGGYTARIPSSQRRAAPPFKNTLYNIYIERANGIFVEMFSLWKNTNTYIDEAENCIFIVNVKPVLLYG